MDKRNDRRPVVERAKKIDEEFVVNSFSYCSRTPKENELVQSLVDFGTRIAEDTRDCLLDALTTDVPSWRPEVSIALPYILMAFILGFSLMMHCVVEGDPRETDSLRESQSASEKVSSRPNFSSGDDLSDDSFDDDWDDDDSDSD